MMVFMPEPHTLLRVVAPVDSGMRRSPPGGRRLAEVGRQHAAHEDLGDVAGRYARLFQGGSDGGRAEGGVGTPLNWPRKEPMAVLGGGDDDVDMAISLMRKQCSERDRGRWKRPGFRQTAGVGP